MQLQDKIEKPLTHRIAFKLTGIRIEIAFGAAPFARLRREIHLSGAIAESLDTQDSHREPGCGLQLVDKFEGRQCSSALFDKQSVRIEHVENFVLERIQGAGDAHQGQHQTCRDPEEPVQLKQDFLQHARYSHSYCAAQLMH